MDQQIQRPHRRSRPSPFRLDFETLFVALIFSTSLFILHLPGAPALMILLLGLFAYMKPGMLSPVMARCWPLLLMPGFALLSTVWSVAPSYSAYSGTEYVVTVALAILIGAGTAERAVLRGLSLAFLNFALFNLHFMFLIRDYLSRYPFVGYAGSKNAAGDMAAFGILCGLSLFIDSMRQGYRGWALLCVPLIVIDIAVIYFAQSAGAVVAVGLGSSLIIAWTLSRALPIPARAMVLFVSVIGGITVVATQKIWFEPLFNTVLKSAGKDSTLTGRAYIWSRADTLIEKRPVLGLGFNAFWREENLEAVAIWRKMGITNHSGYNFHNTFRDIAVHLGIVGLGLFLTLLVVFGIRLLLGTMRRPNQTGIFLAAAMVYECARMSFETLPTGIFYYPTMLLYAGLAYGARAQNKPGSA